jgi:hypothetical protein
MLDEFVVAHRGEIISRCRAKVAARTGPAPAGTDTNRGVPMFLDQLLDVLQHRPSTDLTITQTATEHGRDLLLQGYTVAQVVHDYGDVCQAITDLAVERHSTISSDDFRTLNRCLDDAIAGAVTEFGRDRPSVDDRVIDDARASVTRDLLRAIDISKVAYTAIMSGKVGVSGSTGTVLSMGLDTAHDLVKRLLSDH